MKKVVIIGTCLCFAVLSLYAADSQKNVDPVKTIEWLMFKAYCEKQGCDTVAKEIKYHNSFKCRVLTSNSSQHGLPRLNPFTLTSPCTKEDTSELAQKVFEYIAQSAHSDADALDDHTMSIASLSPSKCLSQACTVEVRFKYEREIAEKYLQMIQNNTFVNG